MRYKVVEVKGDYGTLIERGWHVTWGERPTRGEANEVLKIRG